MRQRGKKVAGAFPANGRAPGPAATGGQRQISPRRPAPPERSERRSAASWQLPKWRNSPGSIGELCGADLDEVVHLEAAAAQQASAVGRLPMVWGGVYGTRTQTARNSVTGALTATCRW